MAVTPPTAGAGTPGPAPAAASPAWLIAIAGSADGIPGIATMLKSLPADFAAAIVIVQHRTSTAVDRLPAVLARRSGRRVPATTRHWSVPRSTIQSGAVDDVLPVEAIGPALDDIVHGRPVGAAASLHAP